MGAPQTLATLSAALLALNASAARAQSPAPVDVVVDAAAQGVPLEPVWPFYGYDEINYTTTAEGAALLRSLSSLNRTPVHVRSHFLFNTGDGTPAMKWGSTNVYTEDTAGNPVYDWTVTDGIFDGLTSAGASPLVELGFTPEALSTHPEPYRNSGTTVLDGGCFYPPTNYGKWAALVRSWATHANARYTNVAANWLWELWNEPDIGYWHGTFADYATLYDYTEAALHDVVPDAVLGGPAVASPERSFLTQFLEHCASGTNAVTGKTGTRLDLVSFHAKGGVTVTGDHVQMDLGNQLRLHRAGFNAVANFPQFTQTPIYITEADPDGCAACPASTAPANAYRNTTAYGAYELSMMKHTIDLAAEANVRLGGVLTWAFTFPGTPYFAGYRVLATNGINLPVLSAFKLLGRLGGTRLPLTSGGAYALDDVLSGGVRGEPEIDGMATRDGDTIRVLLWSYHDDIVTSAETPVRLSLQLPRNFGTAVRITHLRVDQSHGDAYNAWVSAGMPASPSATQLAALQQAMEPSSLAPDQNLVVGSDGAVQLDFTLPRFAVSLLSIAPVAAETDAPQNAPRGCSCRVGGRANAESELMAIGLGTVLLAASATRARHRKR